LPENKRDSFVFLTPHAGDVRAHDEPALDVASDRVLAVLVEAEVWEAGTESLTLVQRSSLRINRGPHVTLWPSSWIDLQPGGLA
jgi:hypothetical protein